VRLLPLVCMQSSCIIHCWEDSGGDNLIDKRSVIGISYCVEGCRNLAKPKQQATTIPTMTLAYISSGDHCESASDFRHFRPLSATTR